MSDPVTPDFLAIGHLTYDVSPEPGNPHGRVRPGGAAAFAAVTARELGLRAALVTSVASSYPVDEVLPGIQLHVVESPFTTFFQNIYVRDGHGENGARRQVLGGRASSIMRSDIPPDWLDTPIVYLGPLVREVPPDASLWFPDADVGVAIQGWLRTWDDYGRVTEDSNPPADLAGGYRLLAGSAAEFPENDRQLLARWTGSAEVLGVTDGPAGARIHTDGREIGVPAYRADEIDPTGAGDIWVAACLIRLVETGDPVEAARFANAAGSVSVEREGLSGAPTRAEIEARMAIGPS